MTELKLLRELGIRECPICEEVFEVKGTNQRFCGKPKCIRVFNRIKRQVLNEIKKK